MSGFRFACVLALASATAQGAAPRLDAVLPPGGQIGKTNTVAALGSIGAWPAGMWCSHEGISFTPEKSKGKFTVSIDPEVPPGPYLVRLHSKDGASDAKLFVVGELPEISEKEDNGSVEAAHSITHLPTVINGALGKRGDTDFFKISLKKGQTISARLDGYRLRSLIDPFLRLHDPRGYETALGSDTHTIDPFLFYRARENGEHWLQVLAIEHKASTRVEFAGSSSAVYRLTITTNGITSPGIEFESDAKESREGDAPQVVEAPTQLAGVLAKAGEVDRYRFAAKKGGQYTVRVESHRHGFPMDPVMVINRPDGKLLREVDDTKPYRDPEYLVKTVEGEYTVEVRDRFRRGGQDLRYCLVIEKPAPSVAVAYDKEIIALEAGKTVDVKLKLARKNGHNAKMSVSVEGLPPGVTIKGGKVDAKAKEAAIKLVVAGDAPAFSGSVQFLLREEGAKPEVIRKASRTFITGDSRGDYLLNGTEYFWMTVKAAPPPKKEEKKKKEAEKTEGN